MTPKEAFKKISISHEMMAYKYNYYLNHRDEGYQMCINPTWEQELDSIKQALTELEELKRYPTSEEVCEALIDYFKKSKYHSYIDTAYYSEEGKYFHTEDENRSLVEIMFDNYYIHEIPPHLITLIGKFYEGVGNDYA